MGLVCMLLPCALCEAPFELCGDAPIFGAYDDGGEPVGRVCPRCVFAGGDGLERRMLRRSERLRKTAERLERLAGEGVRSWPVLDSVRQVQRLPERDRGG